MYFEINSIKVFQKGAGSNAQPLPRENSTAPGRNETAPCLNGTVPWMNVTLPSNGTSCDNSRVPGNGTAVDPEVSPSPTPVDLPGDETSSVVSASPTPSPVHDCPMDTPTPIKHEDGAGSDDMYYGNGGYGWS